MMVGMVRIFFLAATLFAPAFAFASYTVSPLVIDHTVEVRAIETNTITITNNMPHILELFPAVNNVNMSESGTIDSFVPPSMSDRTASLSSWLELSRRPLELKPGEKFETVLTLRVNPNAAPGKYHALISFPEGKNRDEAEAKIPLGGVPGVILNVTIEEKTVEFMALSNFNVDRFILDGENKAVSYTVKNTGDTDMTPRGDILLYDHRGAEVGSIPVNPEAKAIKAGEELQFEAAVPSEGLVGKYKAYLSMQYGENQRAQLQDTAFFYAVPWKKLLVLFVGLLLIAIAISLVVHKRYQGRVDDDDDSEFVPLHVKEGVSGAVPHDIDMKPRI